MGKVDFATVGDAVLRLSTKAQGQLETANSLELDVSGSEANVACHLTRLGHKARWCGCLPRTPLARRATLPLREAGVDFSRTIWRDTGRVSSYYVGYAHKPRETFVIYDRKDSCFESLRADEVNWDWLLDARVFHATGITAALTTNTLEVVATGLKKARAAGVMTSFDVNHRDLLWTAKKAGEAIHGLLPDVDLLFCSVRDAKKLFGLEGDASEIARVLASHQGSSIKWVVVSDEDRNIIGYEKNKAIKVHAYEVEVVDRIGAGDGMAAGVIHGLLSGDFGSGLCYGAALAAYVLSVWGEQPETSVAELDKIIAGENTDIRR